MAIKLNSTNVNLIKLNNSEVTKVTLNGSVVYEVATVQEISISISFLVVEQIGTQYIIRYSAKHDGPSGLNIDMQFSIYISGLYKGTFNQTINGAFPNDFYDYYGSGPLCEYIEFYSLKEAITYNGVEYEITNFDWGESACKP